VDREQYRARLIGAGPGLFLDDQIALDGEDAAALTQVEQLYELWVYVELMAVFAETARDAEAETLASVGQPERRVEARANQAPAAAGAAIVGPSHRIRPQKRRSYDRFEG
jgi:hypothetical protein